MSKISDHSGEVSRLPSKISDHSQFLYPRQDIHHFERPPVEVGIQVQVSKQQDETLCLSGWARNWGFQWQARKKWLGHTCPVSHFILYTTLGGCENIHAKIMMFKKGNNAYWISLIRKRQQRAIHLTVESRILIMGIGTLRCNGNRNGHW